MKKREESNILFFDPIVSRLDDGELNFVAVAACQSIADVNAVIASLREVEIDAFLCEPGLVNDPHQVGKTEWAKPEEWHVMVSQTKSRDAYLHLLKWQQSFEAAWVCDACEHTVDEGHRNCFFCGKQRTPKYA